MQNKETSIDSNDRLKKLKDICLQCRQCALFRTRKNMVFGEGSPTATVMFIGEAPGRDENESGRPFVGRSGKLLRNMIEAIGIKPEDYYIANILKDRPPNNRDPEPDEMEKCIPFLRKQIEIIKPELLVLLGRIAMRGILPDYVDRSIMHMRNLSKDIGNLSYESIPVIVTYHPSALLRSSGYKAAAREDFLFIKGMFQEIKNINDLHLIASQ